jgi:hypothetical protein
MAKTKALATTLLTIFIVAFAGSQEPIPFERRREFKSEALWNLLASPKFKTLQGKIQVTVFLPEGSRSWEMNLWADENRSRVQFELPHPEGSEANYHLHFAQRSLGLVALFAKKALRAEGKRFFPSWRDMWQNPNGQT